MAKKNPLKGALIITVLALGTVSLAVFVLKPQQEKQAKEKDRSTLLFANADRQKIVEIKIENPNGTFDLKRKAEDNEEWRVVFEGKNYAADKGSIDGLISTILAAKKENPIENKDLPSLGLQPHKYRLIVNDGEARDLSLGDDTPVDYLVFAKWNSGPEVFTTTRSLRFGLEKKISDLRNKKIFAAPKLTELTRFEIRTIADDKKPSEKLSFDRNADGQWTSGTTIKAKILASELETFVNLFANTVVTGFASDDPKERGKLGFERPVASLSFHVSKNPKDPPQTWALARVLAPEQSKDPKAPRTFKWYFARLDQDSTFEMAETFPDNFKADLMKFRAKDLATVAKKDITGFSLSDGKSDLEFKKEAKDGGGWQARISSGGNQGLWQKGKAQVIDKTLDQVLGLKAKRFLDGQNPAFLGLKTPSRMVDLRGMQNGAETSVGTLFFGRKLKDPEYAARSLNLDSPVAVDLQLEQILPMNLEHFAEASAAAGTATTSAQTGSASSTDSVVTPPMAASGGKRVKLETTVKNLSDIKKLPAPIVKPGYKYTAEMTLSDDRKLTIEFDAAKAPYTVSNFLHLARNGFYDGLMFHRVIPDFVIQGGDPSSRGKTSTQGIGAGGPGYKFDNEDNDVKHQRGSLSMAHAGRDTNGSQFFIVLKPQPHLDGIHTVFGKLTSGEDIIDSVKAGSFMKKVEVFEQAL